MLILITFKHGGYKETIYPDVTFANALDEFLTYNCLIILCSYTLHSFEISK